MRWIARRDRAEQEVNEEPQTFLDMAAADEVRDGATPDEAAPPRRASTRRARTRPRNACATAAMARGSTFSGRTSSYGWRQVRRNPAFSALAIATLALGIGGITAMFSVFDAVLIRPLPPPMRIVW